MIRSVVTIGNSLGVTLPKDFVEKNKITKGTKISISAQIAQPTTYEAIPDAEFAQLIKDVESRYGKALDELAILQ